jgi:peptide/nickel transport system permease protein
MFSSWKYYFKRLSENRAALIGISILALFLLFIIVSFIDESLWALFNFGIFPYRPEEIFASGARSLEPPSFKHWFGTDDLGQDIFVRIVYGTRLTLRVSIMSGLIGISIGTIFGLVSGYFGGYVDSVIGVINEIFLAIPGILLALGFIVILGQSLDNIMIAVGISSGPFYVRIIRAETIRQKELTYVKAAKVLGAKSQRILFRHILPNVLALVLTYGTLGIGNALLSITGLSYLSPYLSGTINVPEWGAMVADGGGNIFNSPHFILFPGISILLAAVSFNFIGDGLVEALDTRIQSKWELE